MSCKNDNARECIASVPVHMHFVTVIILAFTVLSVFSSRVSTFRLCFHSAVFSFHVFSIYLHLTSPHHQSLCHLHPLEETAILAAVCPACSRCSHGHASTFSTPSFSSSSTACLLSSASWFLSSSAAPWASDPPLSYRSRYLTLRRRYQEEHAPARWQPAPL